LGGDNAPTLRSIGPALHLPADLLGQAVRLNRVEVVAKSRPKVVITVSSVLRASPTGERARRKARIASIPYKFSAMP